MKKIISSICTLVLLINMIAPITLANGGTNVVFEDEKLKNAIIELGHDTNSDGELSQDEMSAITELELIYKGIKDLEGIEYAINLQTLNINGNAITDITPIKNLDTLKTVNIGSQILTFNLGTVGVGDTLELDVPLICKQLELEPKNGAENFGFLTPVLNQDKSKMIIDTSTEGDYSKSGLTYVFDNAFSVYNYAATNVKVLYKVIDYSKTAVFEVEPIRTVAGEQITVKVDMKNDNEFAAANFELSYDNSKLEYVSSKKGEVLTNGMMALVNHDEANSLISVAYTADPTSNNQIKEAGNIVEVVFNVIGGRGTETETTLTCSTLKLGDGTDLPVQIIQGKIQIVNIALNKTETSLDRGTEETLNIVATPEGVDISDQTITWEVDYPVIASVDSNGKIIAKNIGDAVVTAKVLGLTASCNVNVYAALKSISLNKTETTIHRGNDEILTVTYNPDDTTDDKTVTWTSSKESVATVDGTGKVTAVGAGTATITAKVGEKTATCEVTVDVPLESISLNKTETSLNKEENETLTVTYNPVDTTDDKTVTWTSSKETVATVESNGKITAVGAGTATIIANVGGKTATCEVTVYAPLKSISLTKATLTIPQKQVATLGIIYNPVDTTDDKTATWTSSEESVATVDGTGKVTAVGAGTATITANVGGKTATCELTVEGILGDIDGDNMVTAFDAYKALEESIASNKTETTTFALDIDGDGVVTAFDAYKILEKSVGILDGNHWK